MTKADAFQNRLNEAVNRKGPVSVAECIQLAALSGRFSVQVLYIMGDVEAEMTWDDGSTASINLIDG